MKTTKRFILGITATLLLSVGLSAAADKLDPLTSKNHALQPMAVAGPDCSDLTDILDDTNN